jgi:hypothetical protein
MLNSFIGINNTVIINNNNNDILNHVNIKNLIVNICKRRTTFENNPRTGNNNQVFGEQSVPSIPY